MENRSFFKNNFKGLVKNGFEQPFGTKSPKTRQRAFLPALRLFGELSKNGLGLSLFELCSGFRANPNQCADVLVQRLRKIKIHRSNQRGNVLQRLHSGSIFGGFDSKNGCPPKKAGTMTLIFGQIIRCPAKWRGYNCELCKGHSGKHWARVFF